MVCQASHRGIPRGRPLARAQRVNWVTPPGLRSLSRWNILRGPRLLAPALAKSRHEGLLRWTLTIRARTIPTAPSRKARHACRLHWPT